MHNKFWSKYCKDTSKENEGVWIDIEDVSFKMRLQNMTSLAYLKFISENPECNEIKAKEMTPAEIMEGRIKLLTEFSIVDWKGMVDMDTGKELPFSKDLFREILEKNTSFLMDLYEEYIVLVAEYNTELGVIKKK